MIKDQTQTVLNKNDFWKKKDIVTYLLSIMVFLIHIPSFEPYTAEGTVVSNINAFLYRFSGEAMTRYAVPLYFIISGALFFRDYSYTNYLTKLKRRIKTLLIPYIIWNTLWMIFEIITSYSFISEYFVLREKFVLSVPNILEAIFHNKCHVPFWFVFELMFFVLISPIIDGLIRNRYVGISVTILLQVLCLFHIGLPEKLFYSQTAIVYYFVGAIIGKHYFNGFSKKSSLPTQIISIVLLIAAAVVFYFSENIDKNPYFVFLLIPCSWALWNVSDLFVYKLKNYSFFKDSFAVFAIHMNLAAVVAKLFYLLLPKSDLMGLPNFILTFICTLLIIRGFCYLLHRFTPKLYGILMGGR